MYKIYLDGNKTLHHPNRSEDGYVVVDPVLTMEVNCQGSLEFTMMPGHPLYDDIKKLTSIITVYDDEGEVFRGRALNDNVDFYNRKHVYCEGEMAFLLDSIVRPFNFRGTVTQFVQKLISNHNAQVEAVKQFAVGTVSVGDGTAVIERYSDMPMTTWECIRDMLVGSMGGYIRIRLDNGARKFDYLQEYGFGAQVISFGKNLLNLEKYITTENIITCLIPYGKELGQDDPGHQERPDHTAEYDGSRVTIRSVMPGNVDYIRAENGVRLFGEIWGTNTWDAIDDPRELKREAELWLSANIAENLSITVTALDLHVVDVDARKLQLGYKNRVRSVPHNVDVQMQVRRIVNRLLEPDKLEITLGYEKASLIAAVSGGNSTPAKLSAAQVEIMRSISLNYASVTNLTAANARITNLATDTAEILRLYAGEISADEIETNILDANLVRASTAFVDDLVADTAQMVNLIAGNIKAEDVSTKRLSAQDILAMNAKINNIFADNITADTGAFHYLYADNLNANYARIDLENVNEEYVQNLMVQGHMIAKDGDIFVLDAVEVNANKITAGTLSADRILLKQKDESGNTEYYLFTGRTDAEGHPIGEKMDGDILEDRTIAADKLVANSITANELTTQNIVGSGGWINMADGTFRYENTTTGEHIGWNGQVLDISSPTVFSGFMKSGDYVKTGTTKINGGTIDTDTLFANVVNSQEINVMYSNSGNVGCELSLTGGEDPNLTLSSWGKEGTLKHDYASINLNKLSVNIDAFRDVSLSGKQIYVGADYTEDVSIMADSVSVIADNVLLPKATVSGNLTVGEKIIGKGIDATVPWSMPAVSKEYYKSENAFFEVAKSTLSYNNGAAYGYLRISGRVGGYAGASSRFFTLEVPLRAIYGDLPTLTLRGDDTGADRVGFRVVRDSSGIVHVGFNFVANQYISCTFDVLGCQFEPVLAETTVTGTEIAISVDKAQHDAVTQDFDSLRLTAKSWTTCATINVQPGKYLITGGVTLQTAGGVLGVRLDYTEGSGSGEMRGTRAVGNASGTDLYASANATFISSFTQAGSVKLMAYGYNGGTCYGRLRLIQVN